MERPTWEMESDNNTSKKNNVSTLNDPERTIIASDLAQKEHEDVLEIAKDLVSHLSESANVVAATRLRAYGTGSILFPGCFKRKHVTEFTWLGNFC
jgi:lysyl-tRNA synthetase class II